MVKVRNISVEQAQDYVEPLKGQDDILTIVIRDDTFHVTAPLKARIKSKLNQNPILRERFNVLAKAHNLGLSMDGRVDQVVDDAYRRWMRKSLYVLGRHINHGEYGLNADGRNRLFVHLYDAQALNEAIIDKASALISQEKAVKPYMISLDDMIGISDDQGGEISFSRLFSLCGKDYFDYTARPGYPSIPEQMQKVRDDLYQRYQDTGQRVPIVLMEDNVRHARMLNWLEQKMDEAGLFDYADLSGISTCFCAADQIELDKIQHRGQSVPVAVGVNYTGANADVQTPRDLMFDGFVVEVDGKMGRLPGIFMDVAARFSVLPERAEAFRADIKTLNRDFCEDIHENLGVNMPLSWFVGAKPVSYVTNTHTNTSMKKIMK